jgi:hypothetical protein
MQCLFVLNPIRLANLVAYYDVVVFMRILVTWLAWPLSLFLVFASTIELSMTSEYFITTMIEMMSQGISGYWALFCILKSLSEGC